MFSDSDQSCKNSNEVLDFEALISIIQHIDLSKLDDFVTDEIPEGKLLVLELNMRLLVNNADFSKLEALLSFMTGVGKCFALQAASWSQKLAEGRTF